MSIFGRYTQSLNEVYYGKNSLLEDCDKRFEKIKSILSANKSLFSDWGAITLNSDIRNELNVIEKNMKKLFNFKDIAIELTGAGYANAFTIPDSYSLDSIIEDIASMNKKRNSSLGIQYEDGNKKFVYVCLNGELMTICDFTGAEMTGVLLHEIGHNFFFDDSYLSLFYRSGLYILIWVEIIKMLTSTELDGKLSAIMTGVRFLPGANKFRTVVANFINKSPKLSKLSLRIKSSQSSANTLLIAFTGMSQKIASLIYAPGLVLIEFVTGVIKGLTGLISPFVVVGYKNEKFSDNFASAYGYGKEVISAQEKFLKMPLTSADVISNKLLPVYNIGEDIVKTSANIFGYLGDVHPESIARMNDQISYLESQLDTINNPKLKAALQKDIAACKKEINGVDLRVIEQKKIDLKFFSAFYFETMYKIGGDVRENLPFYKTTNYDYKQLKIK